METVCVRNYPGNYTKKSVYLSLTVALDSIFRQLQKYTFHFRIYAIAEAFTPFPYLCNC